MKKEMCVVLVLILSFLAKADSLKVFQNGAFYSPWYSVANGSNGSTTFVTSVTARHVTCTDPSAAINSFLLGVDGDDGWQYCWSFVHSYDSAQDRRSISRIWINGVDSLWPAYSELIAVQDGNQWYHTKADLTANIYHDNTGGGSGLIASPVFLCMLMILE